MSLAYYRYTGTTFNEGWGVEKMSDFAYKWNKILKPTRDHLWRERADLNKPTLASRAKPTFAEAAEALLRGREYSESDQAEIRQTATEMDAMAPDHTQSS